MSDQRPAFLVLEDGAVFAGWTRGKALPGVGEAVFTTGMTGYQEVLTDPSYRGQIVVMTAPQIGNTGTTAEDEEAQRPHVAGFVIHDLSPVASNWRAKETLSAYLARHEIPLIYGVDTRALTRHIRDRGAQMAAIGEDDPQELVARARSAPRLEGRDLTGEVSTPTPYEWTEGSWGAPKRPQDVHVVALDLGIKTNILRSLVDQGCRVTVVPSTSSAKDILALAPDGVFISNGPGDPSAVTSAIETVRELIPQKPLFGICLGHQMLALALGGRTFKMKFGHRGLNHPVQHLSTGKVEITTQNHGFAVDPASVAERCEVTHVHLNDGTCMGLRDRTTGAFSVQYHPEASAGPHDASYLFGHFKSLIAEAKR